jgi:hypothetical protein
MNDIVSHVGPAGLIVVGWFTPDYRHLAETFSESLKRHGAPHHLFAKEKGDGWSTRRKPDVVLDAMALYPERTVVLMDVDCIVSGDISPIAVSNRDVGINVIGRDHRKKCVSVSCSSRVVMFRPTEGAHAFAREWKRRVSQSSLVNDEHAMVWAYLASSGTAFHYLDPRFAGWEVSAGVENAVISHDSAHDRARVVRGFREMLKAIERRLFRSGRTTREKIESGFFTIEGSAP